MKDDGVSDEFPTSALGDDIRESLGLVTRLGKCTWQSLHRTDTRNGIYNGISCRRPWPTRRSRPVV